MNPSLYVLGAGFSKPAGLPLGTELYEVMKQRVNCRSDTDVTILNNLVKQYCQFERYVNGKHVDKAKLNIEEFLSFIDLLQVIPVDYGLGILGNSTRIADGLQSSSHWIRYMIGLTICKCLQERNKKSGELYRQFAERLKPGDFIITFNYDTLLEIALEESGKEFRYFPYAKANPDWSGFGSKVCNPNSNEIIVLKIHGSIDWFDKSDYCNCSECKRRRPKDSSTAHPVFASDKFNPKSLVYAERENDDPLKMLHRIREVEKYYVDSDEPIPHDVPFIIAPSYNKLLHMNKLRELLKNSLAKPPWHNQTTVIGYSLPEYDEYARLALYYMISGCLWNGGQVKFVDYRTTGSSRNEFKCNYRFVDWESVECYFDGFDENAISMIFGE